mmetsp:Transcript_9507/g.9078  ORF Transcript_9507/g.9078 Transcript_9507/m.9078 type:complete len:168 (-) Transcript_9507:46-549(-)
MRMKHSEPSSNQLPNQDPSSVYQEQENPTVKRDEVTAKKKKPKKEKMTNFQKVFHQWHANQDLKPDNLNLSSSFNDEAFNNSKRKLKEMVPPLSQLKKKDQKKSSRKAKKDATPENEEIQEELKEGFKEILQEGAEGIEGMKGKRKGKKKDEKKKKSKSKSQGKDKT